jgi:oligo-1,6-glucosidase
MVAVRSSSDRWWQSAVVYQVYPRSFADSDGDGVGDLPGITSRLDHLAGLGVDVLWLSPIYLSPQDDNGYDISDYTAVEPVFGTLADFDELLAGVHARGMKMIMDVVVNHTSDEHPWFVESRSSTDNPKRDWYWWRPEPATDWQSFFSGPAWQLDEATGEYYLHLFSRKQPDLNWENPQVRAAVYDMMRWWLARGVDGFRMDVINMISKDLAAGVFLQGPRIHEFLAEMHREVLDRHPRPLLTVGEMPTVTPEQAVLFTDPARAEIDMVFQFEHVSLDQGAYKWDLRQLDLLRLKASLGRWQQALADVGWNSLYWNNHDQPRAVSRFGSDAPEHRVAAAKLLASVLHLHRGTPYVYQGEELGMTNAPFTAITDFRDIESINYHTTAVASGLPPDEVLAALRTMSRDNARTPVQWDASANAGFTTGTPWLPVNPNYPQINAADQWTDPDSVLQHYRAAIALRHAEPAVVHGTFTMLLPNHPRIYAFTREYGTTQLLVLANFGADPVPVPLRDPGTGDPGGWDPVVWDPVVWDRAELVLGNLPDPPAAPASAPLRAWEARVLRRTTG